MSEAQAWLFVMGLSATAFGLIMTMGTGKGWAFAIATFGATLTLAAIK